MKLKQFGHLLAATCTVIACTALQNYCVESNSGLVYLAAPLGICVCLGYFLRGVGVASLLIGIAAYTLFQSQSIALGVTALAVAEGIVGVIARRYFCRLEHEDTAETYSKLLLVCGLSALVRTAMVALDMSVHNTFGLGHGLGSFFSALQSNTALLPLLVVCWMRREFLNLPLIRWLEFCLCLIIGWLAIAVVTEQEMQQSVPATAILITIAVAIIVVIVFRTNLLGACLFLAGGSVSSLFATPWAQAHVMVMPSSVLIVQCGFFAAMNIATIAWAANVWERRISWNKMQALLCEVERQRDELQKLSIEAAKKQATLVTALDQLPAGFVIVDAQDVLIHMNRTSQEWFQGLNVELGSKLHEEADWSIYLPDGTQEPTQDCAILKAATRGITTAEQEIVIEPHYFPEHRRALTISAAPIMDDAGSNLGAVVLIQDLSEQKRTASRLRESEERLRIVLKTTRLMLWEHNSNTGLTTVSEPFGVWHGLPASLHVDSFPKLLEQIHPEDSEHIEEIRNQVRAGLLSEFEFSYRILQQDKSTKTFLTRGYVIPHTLEAKALRTTGVIIDITKQREDEQRLRMHESAVVHARDAVIVLEAHPTDQLGRKVLYVNPAFESISGYSSPELVGRSLHFLRGPETDTATLDQLRRALESGEPLQTELLNYRKDGTKYWVELSLVPVPDTEAKAASWVMIQRDISERKASEEALRARDEQLRQAQKMETVGQLAGGVAHDFNNLLTAVIGNLCLVDMPDDDPNKELLHVAEQAAHRAADLTKKLLGFARRSQILVRPLCVADFVDEVVNLLRRTIDPLIEINYDIDKSLTCLADATLLNQVLLNLCLNARDAMPAGGLLSINAKQVCIVDHAEHKDDADEPNMYIRLSVTDTGHGMSADTQSRLYEPFFTTKPLGQGTGLGLAMVHGIVKQHRGWIDCQSTLGKGTTFIITLPATTLPTTVHTPLPDTNKQRMNIESEPEKQTTILLVDDEEMIRTIAKTVFEQAGYTVVEACDGEEAIELYLRHQSDIGLVVLDMIMPKLSGRDAAERIHAINPHTKIILSSGYSADDIAEVAGVHAVLTKPYRPSELLRVVQEALQHHAKSSLLSV